MLKKILFISGYFMIAGVSCFAGEDDSGKFYADDRDQILEWIISIDQFGLIKDDNTEVTIISSPTGTVNIADPDYDAGEVAGYFTTGVSLPPGTYTRFSFTQGDNVYYKGCIQIGDGTWRATGQGNTSYATKAEALAACTRQTFTFDFDYETSELGETFICEENRSYTLKILWQVTGTDAEDGVVGGVGLIWDPDTNEFDEGFLCQNFVFVEND